MDECSRDMHMMTIIVMVTNNGSRINFTPLCACPGEGKPSPADKLRLLEAIPTVVKAMADCAR
jgi:hypothetical protein